MTGAEMMSEMANAYTPSLIYRNTNWVFYAGKPVYLLREPSGAVWVLQEMTQDVDPSLEPDNLDQLGEQAQGAAGGLDVRDQGARRGALARHLRAGGWAAIIRDELGCAYQGCGYGADTNANYVP